MQLTNSSLSYEPLFKFPNYFVTYKFPGFWSVTLMNHKSLSLCTLQFWQNALVSAPSEASNSFADRMGNFILKAALNLNRRQEILCMYRAEWNRSHLSLGRSFLICTDCPFSHPSVVCPSNFLNGKNYQTGIFILSRRVWISARVERQWLRWISKRFRWNLFGSIYLSYIEIDLGLFLKADDIILFEKIYTIN